jgi:hypothetical protein
MCPIGLRYPRIGLWLPGIDLSLTVDQVYRWLKMQ